MVLSWRRVNGQPTNVHFTAKERRQMKSVNVKEALEQKEVKRRA
jgi:hypothetical protein